MTLRRALPYVLYAIAHVAFVAWVFIAAGGLFGESLYERAVEGTRVPPGLLRSIAIVESRELDTVIGDDGISLGRFQLNENFRAWREARWGKHNPLEPLQAGRVAARILEYNYRALGRWDCAIAAYRQGVDGVRRGGPTWWYVKRVCKAWACLVVEGKIKRNTWRGK